MVNFQIFNVYIIDFALSMIYGLSIRHIHIYLHTCSSVDQDSSIKLIQI